MDSIISGGPVIWIGALITMSLVSARTIYELVKRRNGDDSSEQLKRTANAIEQSSLVIKDSSQAMKESTIVMTKLSTELAAHERREEEILRDMREEIKEEREDRRRLMEVMIRRINGG